MLSVSERRLLSESGESVVAVEDGGIIAFAGTKALAMLGWNQELIGRPLTTIIPTRLQARHQAGFARYARTGVSKLQNKPVRVPGLRRDGSERDVMLRIRVFQRPDGSKLVAAEFSDADAENTPVGLVEIESDLQRRAYQLV
jgi:PAS domain S-box-containing protein